MTESITIQDLTDGSLDGDGVFDVMMKTVHEHVDREYKGNRIRGPEYSQVYLGSLQATMSQAVQFLLSKDRVANESEILRLQAINLEIEGRKAEAEVLLINAQAEKMAQDVLVAKQNVINAESENLRIIAATKLLDSQNDLAIKDLEVKAKQICKLDAEFTVLEANFYKIEAETRVLEQKAVTERAQTDGAGVNQDSVIGKQMNLYQRQADGFLRDAEQKAARIMTETWNVRRTTDEGTIAGAENQLADVYVGRVMEQLQAGVGASS